MEMRIRGGSAVGSNEVDSESFFLSLSLSLSKLKSICIFTSELMFAICLPALCCGQKSRRMAYVTRKLILCLLQLVPSYWLWKAVVPAVMNTSFRAVEINAETLVYRCITLVYRYITLLLPSF